MLRPPRVERQPDGSVVLTLKRPWANGTTSPRFAPAELVARLIALIPPGRTSARGGLRMPDLRQSGADRNQQVRGEMTNR
jgi:hypothetical protein